MTLYTSLGPFIQISKLWSIIVSLFNPLCIFFCIPPIGTCMALCFLVIRGFCYIRPLYNEVPLYNKSNELGLVNSLISHLAQCTSRRTVTHNQQWIRGAVVAKRTRPLTSTPEVPSSNPARQLCPGQGALHYINILFGRVQCNLIITRSLGPWKLPCYIRFVIISGLKTKEK